MSKTAIREMVAAGGVIVSLVFVGLEIRANTSAVRGATIQGISDQSIEAALAVAEIPEMREGFAKIFAGREAELTPAEEDALVMLYTAVMRISENRFRQRQLGVFETPEAVGGGAAMYRVPFFRTFWDSRRFEYPSDFANYVDEFLLPLVGDSIPRVLPR